MVLSPAFLTINLVVQSLNTSTRAKIVVLSRPNENPKYQEGAWLPIMVVEQQAVPAQDKTPTVLAPDLLLEPTHSAPLNVVSR
jgi:hypothetical protein